MLHFPPPDQPGARPPACGKPPPPEEEEEDLEDEKEAPGGSQEPSDGGGGAKPTPLAQVHHLLPRCVTSCQGACSPAHRGPTWEPGRPGMVTLMSGNDPGAWPGYTLFVSSSGSKYRPQNTGGHLLRKR